MKQPAKFRAPVLAAGGIVVREASEQLIAVVRLRKDKSWVLPKGKLKPGEDALAGARREVMEEGYDVRGDRPRPRALPPGHNASLARQVFPRRFCIASARTARLPSWRFLATGQSPRK